MSVFDNVLNRTEQNRTEQNGTERKIWDRLIYFHDANVIKACHCYILRINFMLSLKL